MLKTVVKKGSYQDSVVLMLLTNELSSLDGVNKIQVMMATPANKDIFKQSIIKDHKNKKGNTHILMLYLPSFLYTKK